ncbi:hypothetical protein [Sinomonas sp. ASV322]|uniref:hypothetical protein n=1 Tax=Sinomonas sp. ASV322 TaxID=3041920 RepID=UPI0027DB376B|nr:hypothetical protein [Sinomonas sp. ASV322]MDQ4501405.1 hypothetical protein [Sinomonas sp. ASV322]
MTETTPDDIERAEQLGGYGFPMPEQEMAPRTVQQPAGREGEGEGEAPEDAGGMQGEATDS